MRLRIVCFMENALNTEATEYERLKQAAEAEGTCMDCGAPAEPGVPVPLCYGCAKYQYE